MLAAPLIQASTTVASSKWSVPLYLFHSPELSDTALLPSPPKHFGVPCGARSRCDSYTKLLDGPVAYVHDTDAAPSHPLVSLFAYWSEERQDIQTTDWSLAKLNAHGGNYTLLATIGLVSVEIPAGTEAAAYVPMRLSYDHDREDAATAPLSGADLNHLVDGATFGSGHVVGFAKAASCSVCNISMSESFPSAGGPDCAWKCDSDRSCFDTTYRLGGDKEFSDAMAAAAEVLKQFGDVEKIDSGSGLHVSFNYFCCYTEAERGAILSVLRSFPWPTLNVSFDRPTWRIDSGDGGSHERTADSAAVDHQSIIVLLDGPSQQAMLQLVGDVEARIRAAGVDVHVPRAKQEPFHSTLGVVSGKGFPAAAALAAINKATPPGKWSRPITLSGPPAGVGSIASTSRLVEA